MISRNSSFLPVSLSVEPQRHLQEIVFIDRGVEDYEFLARGIRQGVELHLLGSDAIAQITTVLAERNDLRAVHVVSHGAPGCLYLGEGELSLSTLGQHEVALRSWFANYAEDEKPELLLYGCNVAAGDAGEEFLAKLHRLLATGIAASKDITGHIKHQGNWELTEQRGAVTAPKAFTVEVMASYNYQLNWVQLGSDINGEASEDSSGWSVSLSADGSTVAIGAPFNDGNVKDEGQVRLYRLNQAGTDWVQLGSDINGEAVDDNSGWRVSLSADGSTVAIGAINNDGNGNSAGQVRLYSLNQAGTDWVQLGGDLDGEAGGDQAGIGVSLSPDGSTVAVGARYNADNGSFAGHVRLYRLNQAGTDWVQLGGDLDSEAASDNFGASVSLSEDGSTVAIGAPFNDGNGNDAGHVRLYRLNQAGTDWVQLGGDIDGEAGGDQSGYSVSLSADGSTVAIGAPLNDGGGGDAGQVRLYRLNQAGTDWVQLGGDLDGEAASDQSGQSVSLSADGSTIAIGAFFNDGGGSGDAGHVRLYRLNQAGTDWVQLGNDLDGDAANDWFGRYVSLSADGSTVAAGAPFDDGNGNNAGQVRLYRFEPESNTAPSFTGNAALAPINEDEPAPNGETIANLFTPLFSDSNSDSNLNGFSGIAVVGNSANAATEGSWQYSTDSGSNWFALGTVADNATALALETATHLRFLPVADYNGTPPVLTVRALDSTHNGSFTSGSTRETVDTSTNGGETAIAGSTNNLTTSVTAVNDPVSGSITLPTSATEDAEITADTSGLSDAEGLGSFSYQWQSQEGGEGSFTNIANATSASFTPGDDEVGDALQVVVSYTDGNGTQESVTSTATDTVANINDAPTVDGQIATQNAQEEFPFSFAIPANAFSDVDDESLTYTAQLNQGGEGIPGDGATPLPQDYWLSFDGTTFTGTPENADVGDITLEVTATDSGNLSVTQLFTLSVANTNDRPRSGTNIENQTATEDTAFSFNVAETAFEEIDPGDSLSFTAQINNGTHAEPNLSDFPQGFWLTFDGNNLTFSGTPGDSDIGSVTIRITATDTADATAFQEFTLDVSNVNDDPSGSITLPTSATEDSEITADTGALADDDGLGEFSYQWQSQEGGEGNFADIAGATDASFTPGDEQVGDALQVVVSYTDGNGTSETITSSATGLVANVNDPVTGSITLPTSATEDAEITADTSGLSDADGLGSFSYQWQEGGEGSYTNIAGATNASFTPEDAQVGQQLRVVVSYTDAQGTAETVTSQATTSVAGINDAPTVSGPSSIDVAEDATPGTVLASFTAGDVDGSAPLFSISAGNDAGLFTINSAGEVSLASNAELDFESGTTSYNITITATEATGSTPLTADAALTLNVTNVIEGSDPASIAWNTETGVVSALAIDIATATASLTPTGRTITDPNWALQTVGDMDGDGQKDVLLRHATAGQNLVLYMNPGGQSIRAEALIGRDVPDVNWSIAGTGDMNGDGNIDIVLRNQAADQILAWYMDGAGNILSESIVGREFGDNNWKIEAMADFNRDGKADILLRHAAAGQNLLWEMDGSTIIGESLFGREVPDVNWQIEGANDFDGNGTIDVLMRHVGAGQALLWSMADKNTIETEVLISNVPDGTSQLVF